MALTDHYFEDDIVHPIDMAEHVAHHHDWEFDRVHDNQIAMAVEGQWRTYSITLAWCDRDETLRLICTFEMEPPAARMADLFELLNLINDECWAGNFVWWEEHRTMAYRYGLVLAGDQPAGSDQIDTMLGAALRACEKYYPAMQLATWAERAPKQAMDIAMAEAYGRA